MTFAAYLVAATMLLAPCEPPIAKAEVSAANGDTALVAFAKDPFANAPDGSMILYSGKAEVIARFGEPDAIETILIEDEIGGHGLTRYLLQYSGFDVSVLESADRKSAGIDRIEFHDSRPRLKYGVGVGASRDDVIAGLNPEESWRKAAAMRLKVETRGQDSDGSDLFALVTVEVDFDRSDTVTRIALTAYPD